MRPVTGTNRFVWSAGIYTGRVFRIDPVTMEVLDTTSQAGRRMNGFGTDLWIAEWSDVHLIPEASGVPEVVGSHRHGVMTSG